ncbi:MAG: SMP-30/gluconolactonase/LRE family protein [Acidimicrobiales bacterium]
MADDVTPSETRVLLDGLAFGESVRWHDGRVWVCDWVDGDVLSVAPDGSDRRVEAHVDGFPVCIDWTADGELLVVNGRAGQLLRCTAAAGDLVEVADLTGLSPHPWNEVAAHPGGWAYVDGIGFDMMGGQPSEPAGLLALVDIDRGARIVAEGLAFPNGMVVVDDGATLLVAESHAGRISAFAVADDGTLGERRTWAEVADSAPDGIGIAGEGSIWYADVPNEHCRRVAEGGEVQATVALDRGGFSCAAGPDGTLYVAATVWDEQTFTTRRGRLLATAP